MLVQKDVKPLGELVDNVAAVLLFSLNKAVLPYEVAYGVRCLRETAASAT
jgi:hypothetical protein